MNLDDLDLAQASRIYGVANTPLFLLRKLQGDQSVRSIADRYTGEDILETLRPLLNTEPANAVEAVRPYALLVALWFKPEVEHLREAAQLHSVHGWYSYASAVLLETFSAIQRRVIQVPGVLQSSDLSHASTASTNRIILAG